MPCKRFKLFTQVAIAEDGMMNIIYSLKKKLDAYGVSCEDVTELCDQNKVLWFYLFSDKKMYLEVTILNPETKPRLAVVLKHQKGRKIEHIFTRSVARYLYSKAKRLNESFNYEKLCVDVTKAVKIYKEEGVRDAAALISPEPKAREDCDLSCPEAGTALAVKASAVRPKKRRVKKVLDVFVQTAITHAGTMHVIEPLKKSLERSGIPCGKTIFFDGIRLFEFSLFNNKDIRLEVTMDNSQSKLHIKVELRQKFEGKLRVIFHKKTPRIHNSRAIRLNRGFDYDLFCKQVTEEVKFVYNVDGAAFQGGPPTPLSAIVQNPKDPRWGRAEKRSKF